jgi:hypothetical protein
MHGIACCSIEVTLPASSSRGGALLPGTLALRLLDVAPPLPMPSPGACCGSGMDRCALQLYIATMHRSHDMHSDDGVQMWCLMEPRITATAQTRSCCLLEDRLDEGLWRDCQRTCIPAATCSSAAASAKSRNYSQQLSPFPDCQPTLPRLLQGRCSRRQLLLSATRWSPRWRWRPGPKPWWTWAAVTGSSSRCIKDDLRA